MTTQSTSSPLNIFRKRTPDIDQNQNVNDAATRFRDRFDGKDASVEARKGEATELVNEYYDLVTDFYEYGWGQSFHFAPQYKNENFYESLARHEYFLALEGNFHKGDRVLDLGCGVGGPARAIARFTGCNVTGVNNNAYQITRGRRYGNQMGLSHRVNYVKSDFCNMPFKDNEFDGAYAIEATCHATDKVACYSEICRVLKPGSCFTCYEWIITDKYDDSNELHRKIRHGIELGNGLPTLDTAAITNKAITDSGFEIVKAYDLIEEFEKDDALSLPWYTPLAPSYSSLSGLKSTPLGRWVTSTMTSAMEMVHIAPKGSRKAADILEEAAQNLVLGGKLGIFTPSYFIHARKPKA